MTYKLDPTLNHYIPPNSSVSIEEYYEHAKGHGLCEAIHYHHKPQEPCNHVCKFVLNGVGITKLAFKDFFGIRHRHLTSSTEYLLAIDEAITEKLSVGIHWHTNHSPNGPERRKHNSNCKYFIDGEEDPWFKRLVRKIEHFKGGFVPNDLYDQLDYTSRAILNRRATPKRSQPAPTSKWPQPAPTPTWTITSPRKENTMQASYDVAKLKESLEAKKAHLEGELIDPKEWLLEQVEELFPENQDEKPTVDIVTDTIYKRWRAISARQADNAREIKKIKKSLQMLNLLADETVTLSDLDYHDLGGSGIEL